MFVVYDMIDDVEELRLDGNSNLSAVWTTRFSKDFAAACYDSNPDTYIASGLCYKEVVKIPGKSFLCFSPSGKYVALSEQGYIDFTHHPHEDWGHQPSTNVYVYSVEDLPTFTFIGPFNDLGDDVDGTSITTRKFNVASAAFSSDDNKLLMVGEDGVVVVRFLYHEPPTEYDPLLDPETISEPEFF